MSAAASPSSTDSTADDSAPTLSHSTSAVSLDTTDDHDAPSSKDEPLTAAADPAIPPTADYPASSPSTLDYELQVTAPPIDSAVQAQIDELRAQISSEPVHRDHPFIQAYCTDQLLHRYLRARPGSLPRARALLLETLAWRASYRPDLILASEVSAEASSGKILTLHHDRYGRPIVLMDNSYNVTHDHAAAIRHLVFHLERARNAMRGSVEKFNLVVNLERHSFFNQPPIATALETTRILMSRYAEHLGSAVCYQPPAVFRVLYAAASPLFDSKMTSKIVWAKGGTEEGGAVDAAMRNVVGDDWKAKLRVDCPNKPRYDHAKEWPRVVQEQRDWLQQHGLWDEVKDKFDTDSH